MDKNLGQDTSWGLKIGGCVTYDELEDNQLHLSTQAYIVFDLYILVPLSPGVRIYMVKLGKIY